MKWEPTHIMYNGGNIVQVMQVKEKYFFTQNDIHQKRISTFVVNKGKLYMYFDKDFKVNIEHWELRDLDYYKEKN